MAALLDVALAAHGGSEAWLALRSVRAEMTITGAIWAAKGRPNILGHVQVAANLHEQYLVLRPSAPARWYTTFDRGSMSLFDEGGLIERRDHPALMYAEHAASDPWSDLEVAYYATQALWTQLTLPFLYSYRGFDTTEIESRQEDGETWRRLQVQFPPAVASHSAQQVTAFGPDGLLRRHEYDVDMLSGATTVMYASDMHRFGGIAVPTRRRIYTADRNGDRVDQPLLAAIDIQRLCFSATELNRPDVAI